VAVARLCTWSVLKGFSPIQPQSEQQYFHKYCNLVAEYMGGEGLDITGVRSVDVKT
jgi:hypothetical protein